MCSDVAGVATLRDGAVFVWCAECVNAVGAVVLLIRLAVVASQVCADLRTDTDTVADFDGLDVFANLDRLAYHLVADADGQWAVAPAAVDGVDIGAANAAAFDGDVNVAVLELLELELWVQWVSKNLRCEVVSCEPLSSGSLASSSGHQS